MPARRLYGQEIPLIGASRRPSKESGYLDLLRSNANFRRIWFGEVVSNFGDWFNVIASAALLGALTGSGAAVGALFVIRMLAPFVVSPLAGVIADRYNRKHLMIVADLTRSLVVLGFLLVREPGDVWLLYLLTAVQLGLAGFFVPARSAILPEVVAAGEIGRANALSSATFAVMLSLGAGIGGFVSGTLGVYVLMVALAVEYFPLGEGGGISLGLIFCATGVGTALGPIIARRFTRDRERALRKGLVVCYLVSAVGLASAAPVLSLAMVLVGLVIRGLGGGMMFVFSTHLLMARVPNSVRGRVFSTEFAVRTLFSAVGTMVISLGIDTSLGTPGMLWVVAGAALVPGLVWWRWITAVPSPPPALVPNEVPTS
jgi:MFS family permease